MTRKKGLLIAPRHPADTFWSYRHIMRHIGCKTAYPPLGLITFATQMPQDRWDFELIDLNVKQLPDRILRRKIDQADAVFVGAMNVQRDSLTELLAGPAKGLDTPWVLGGPLASSYRDTILDPQTPKDQILHDGLDFLVWGEAGPWIDALNQALVEHPRHRADTPTLFIPQRVLDEPAGSRKYLRDETIFRSLEAMPIPRWDLLNVQDYHFMMLQSTAGCRFRCNFCDIVQFNGGFARIKEKNAITQELQAIYDTGFRGTIFTVDDNFVSEPKAMEYILEGMIEFQRSHNYPFSFFTQASVDLGKEDLAHLIPLMKLAGFYSVFLGVENPDADSLKSMNKIQNIKTAPEHTIALLQEEGIEVFAGFIYGTDGDTRQTADHIIDFVRDNAILSATTGKLTPFPHTPLYVDLEQEGRLLKGTESSNTVDDSLEFLPLMGIEQHREGYRHILNTLFSRPELYRRARSVLDRLETHIFRNAPISLKGVRALCFSVFRQGLWGRNGFWDRDYFKLLLAGVRQDRKVRDALQRELDDLALFWERAKTPTREYIELDPNAVESFYRMSGYAEQALVRYAADKDLAEIHSHIQSVRQTLDRDRSLSITQAQFIYQWAMMYLDRKRRMLRLPGFYTARAIQLAIMGFHYRTAIGNMLKREDNQGLTAPM